MTCPPRADGAKQESVINSRKCALAVVVVVIHVWCVLCRARRRGVDTGCFTTHPRTHGGPRIASCERDFNQSTNRGARPLKHSASSRLENEWHPATC